MARAKTERLVHIVLCALLAAVLVCATLFAAGCAKKTDDAEKASDDTLAVSDKGSAKETWVAQAIAGMTLEEKVAQLFIIRPEELTGYDTVTQAGDTTEKALNTYPVGGLIYFGKNLESAGQTREMLAKTQEMAQEASDGIPIFLCVDEEGGDIARVANNAGFDVEDVGSAQSIGALGSTDRAQEAAKTIGSYLSDLGFNVDFAPVADVASVSDSFMMSRSFGSDADAVSDMVSAQVRGFAEAGIVCAAKHFPGLGSLSINTDFDVSSTDRSLHDFRDVDLRPFSAGIEAGVPIIMVGHVLTPGASTDGLPASLSAEWITGVLREELGYQGLVVTDALEVPIIGQVTSDSHVGVDVLLAGGDLILLPPDWKAAYQGILDAVASGELTEGRIDESLTRILNVKYGLQAD